MSRQRSNYSSLDSSRDETDGMENDDVEREQFTIPNKKDDEVPWRTLFLVIFLFFGGLITLLVSSLILIGHLDNDVYADRMWPLLIIGIIMFIPGFYYMRVAYKSFRRVPGYSYEQIPSCY